MLMGMFMRGNGNMIRHMVGESTYIRMEHHTVVSGLRISNMGSVLRNGLMEHSMRDNMN